MSCLRGSPRCSSDFIAGLPKAELHVHHVGSASPRIVSELAERHPGTVPSDPEELRRFFEFRDFGHFIEVYLAVVGLIRTPEDIRYLTHEVGREMATEQGLRYAELTCTPYTSVRPDSDELGDADRGLHRGDRGRPGRGRARLRAGAALDLRHPGGVGRARRPTRPSTTRSTTAPTRWSASASAVPRSGCRGRSSSRTSTRPGPPGCTACRTPARRPGRRRSGTRSGCSAPSGSGTAPRRRRTRRCWPTSPRPASRSRSARRRTSRPGRSPRLEEHPIRAFRDAGVTVTVNSDDPPMFDTTLNREYEIAADLLDLDEAAWPTWRGPPYGRRSRRGRGQGPDPRRDRRVRRPA